MNEEWDWLEFALFVIILFGASQVMRHIMGV